jgi:hypothetical protein
VLRRRAASILLLPLLLGALSPTPGAEAAARSAARSAAQVSLVSWSSYADL